MYASKRKRKTRLNIRIFTVRSQFFISLRKSNLPFPFLLWGYYYFGGTGINCLLHLHMSTVSPGSRLRPGGCSSCSAVSVWCAVQHVDVELAAKVEEVHINEREFYILKPHSLYVSVCVLWCIQMAQATEVEDSSQQYQLSSFSISFFFSLLGWYDVFKWLEDLWILC